MSTTGNGTGDSGGKPPLYVTRPFLPPLEEFIPYLEQIWANGWLTNNGPLHEQFEAELARRLGVEHLSLFSNGTLALITALQALRITGEVITTPFSFVATSHSLIWNGIQPVFVDIDPATCNLDPAKIEAAITPRTTAILPVHVYGTPCDTGEIGRIADTYGLKVIYDAAHAFAVNQDGRSVLAHGDLSVLSFHATKVFTTFEGGAIICQDRKTKTRIDHLKNFGIADETTVIAPGINAKLNEVQAAFGLLQLRHVDGLIAARGRIDARYREALADVPGLTLFAPPAPDRQSNYGYFPVLVEDAYPVSRDELYTRLRAHGVFARRYFYPLISAFPMYRGLASARPENLPVANSIARRILCLPIYPTLTDEQHGLICELVRNTAS